MPGAFNSEAELRAVIDRTFELMSADPAIGPKFAETGTSQRFEFTDYGLAVNIRPVAEAAAGANLRWEWGEAVGWEPAVRLAMDSEVANRYFQGRENVAIAIARRRIRAGGDLRAALALIPLMAPVHAHYRHLIASDYPHLEV